MRRLPPPLALLLLLAPGGAWADGDNAHSTLFNEVVPGGGLFSEGLGFARRFGAPEVGVMEITQLPPGAQIVQAYLYWVMIAGFDDTVTINGQDFTGDWIGTTQDTCWNWGDNHVYRARVRDAVTGNGTYEITGFDYVSNVIDNQGFSVVVIYREPTSSAATRIIINDGAIYAGDGYPVIPSTATFDPLPGPITSTRVHFGVGDSQGADDGPTRVNGVQIAQDNFEGSDGVGGDGGMWDDDTIDISGLGIVNVGDTSITATISDPPGSDCLAFTMFAAEITYPNPCPDADLDGFTTCDGDCDDDDASVSPAGTETANGVDDDCDGVVDNLPADNDGDGWDELSDCDDDDPAVYPGGTEICDNGVDDDCDFQIDEADCEEPPEGDDDDDGADDDDSAGGDDDDDGGGRGGGGGRRGGCGCDGAATRTDALAGLVGLLGLLGLAPRARRR